MRVETHRIETGGGKPRVVASRTLLSALFGQIKQSDIMCRCLVVMYELERIFLGAAPIKRRPIDL